jgi:hypothetical protein
MTEAEWLACADPQPMLGMLTKPADWPLISDRKLRLWVAGCWVISGVQYCEFDLVNADVLHGAVRDWSRSNMAVPTLADRAALLREIVGNPWRPATNLCGSSRRDKAHVWEDCGVCSKALTLTVLSLAQTAYDERPGRECGPCGGKGSALGRRCDRCHGAGRVEVGALDPVRLAVLADALEDAVGPGPELLGHLRSKGPHVRGCWAVDCVLGRE